MKQMRLLDPEQVVRQVAQIAVDLSDSGRGPHRDAAVRR
jgi:hypothetical protein